MNFNKPIDIQTKTVTKDRSGQDIENWTLLVKTGANIMQLSQREQVSSSSGGQEVEDIMMKFEIRRTSQNYNLNSSTHRIRTLDPEYYWEIINVDHFSLKHRNIIKIFARRSF